MEPDKNEKKNDKRYIKSKKKWNQFKLHDDIIDALRDDNKHKPTLVQQKTLQIALNVDRKKFNLMIRSINGSGKTLAFLIPMINSLQPGLKTAQDKTFRGKTQQNQIFTPQGVVIVQNNLLQKQITDILDNFISYGKQHQSEKLRYKIGKMAKDQHIHGDIVVCQVKSILNRHSRGNIKFDNCKFIAIDEIDDIYEHDKDGLAKFLEISSELKTHTICCSATMKKQFIEFYDKIVKNLIKLNINQEMLEQQDNRQRITLQGVKNYYHNIQLKDEKKTQIYNFIIKVIFKHLYSRTQQKKPQIFIFFNSVQDIYDFEKIFDALASDFTTQQSDYLKDISKGILAAKTFIDGKKTDLTIPEKQQIMKKFRNNQTNILLSTNIIARGIDVRNACFVINVGSPKKTDKENDVDIDIFLHRVGRTGRHNDKGISLTIGEQKQIQVLVNRVSKVFGLDVKKLDSPEAIVNQVYTCIDANG